MNESSEIMTPHEVAQALRVSKSHVHNLINGKVAGSSPLPSIPLGRSRRIRRTALLAWMKQSENNPIGDMLLSSSKIVVEDA